MKTESVNGRVAKNARALVWDVGQEPGDVVRLSLADVVDFANGRFDELLVRLPWLGAVLIQRDENGQVEVVTLPGEEYPAVSPLPTQEKQDE
ncbi:MAG: hypothetical protein MUO37_14405 [Methyloceanibacter sp.]|nr:hypothetical protein [Methyloceanibacter sp.]